MVAAKTKSDAPAKKSGRRPGTKKTGGRKKGTPNKISATVKDNVIQVFEQLGSVKGMVNWAKKNQTEFYRIYAKMLPVEVANAEGKALKLTFERVVGERGATGK